jgi:hypothetical protein
MGELKRQTLGDASGAVGHLVFRIKGDQNIIAKRPLKKVNPKLPSAEVLARREKFKLTGMVAGGIYDAGSLKEIWPKPAANKGSRFTVMFKKNYSIIGTVDNLGTVQVIPDHGIIITNAAIALTQKGMTITADELGADAAIDPNLEKFLVAVGVVVMRTPTNPSDAPFKILSVKTGMQSLDNDTPISMNFEFGSLDLSQYSAYTDKKVFLTFLTLTSAGVPVHWTEQFKN